MGVQRTFRIVALGAHHDLQSGPVDQFRFDPGHQLEIHIRDQQQRLERFHFQPVLMILGDDAIQRNSRPGADLRQCGRDVPAILAHQRQPVGQPVVRQDHAVDVGDQPPRRENPLLAQAVFLRLPGEILALVDLQIPEAHDENEKQHAHHALQQQHAGARRLVVLGLDLDLQPAANTPPLRFVFGFFIMPFHHERAPIDANTPPDAKPRE